MEKNGFKFRKSLKDITGQKFGTFTVLELVGKTKRCKSLWKCRCDCGREFIIRSDLIKICRVKYHNCDPKKSEIGVGAKHGHAYKITPEYRAWICIKTRCYNFKSKFYKHYGARGIKMSEEWVNSFEKFLEDMGPKPTKKHSIDRIDNNGNYCKENCRWSNWLTQANNRRNNLFFEIDGTKLTLAEIARKYNLDYGKTYQKLRRGRLIEDLLKDEHGKQ